MLKADYSPLKEDEIIEALALNNIEAAVEMLYEGFFNEAIDYIVLNGGSEDDGADVFQDSILGLIDLLRKGKFRGDSSLKTILFAIIRNNWHRHLRSRERRKKREELYVNVETEKWDNIPDKRVEDNIGEILNRLGEQCKEILVGFYFSNLSKQNLLEKFDFKNEQVLRNRKSICMKKLKELLLADKTLLQNLKFEYQL